MTRSSFQSILCFLCTVIARPRLEAVPARQRGEPNRGFLAGELAVLSAEQWQVGARDHIGLIGAARCAAQTP